LNPLYCDYLGRHKGRKPKGFTEKSPYKIAAFSMVQGLEHDWTTNKPTYKLKPLTLEKLWTIFSKGIALTFITVGLNTMFKYFTFMAYYELNKTFLSVFWFTIDTIFCL
jgi:hypothetical protein